MVILLDNKMPVVIQGITGREGSLRAQYQKEYGTNVVAGVTPGRGGSMVGEIPVYNTIAEAIRMHGPIEVSNTFVPGPYLKDAVLEAIDNDIKLIIAPVERVPLHDILQMMAAAKRKGARILGPGSIGVLNTNISVAGWLGGNLDAARRMFIPGPIGVISRSGGQSGTVPFALKQVGLGVSAVVHVGTEPVVGISMGEILEMFEVDKRTRIVAAFGEIGGPHEEEAAEIIRAGKYTKPFVIYIAGVWVPEGMRFSHASSIIERGKGTAQSKMDALREVGAYVVERPDQLAPTVKDIYRTIERR